MYNDKDELWSTKKERYDEQVKILQKKSGRKDIEKGKKGKEKKKKSKKRYRKK